MYLHVGNNKTIRQRDIVGIFDADTATVSAVTKKYLAGAQAAHRVQFASLELPKSFVLYRDRSGKYKICFSQLSPAALASRPRPEAGLKKGTSKRLSFDSPSPSGQRPV